MKKGFLEQTTFKEKWSYQQCVYWENIVGNLKSIVLHFPMGFLNFFVQLIISSLSLIILFGNTLEYWANTILIRKPKILDIPDIKDQMGRTLVVKAQKKAIEDYHTIVKTLLGFILGIIATLITVSASK